MNENLEKYIKLKADVKNLKGKIHDVKEMTNHDFFGSEEYDLKKGVAVYYTIDGDKEEYSEWFNIPNTPKGVLMENANINKFFKRYGGVPEKNMKIDITVNDDGFYRIEC